MSLSVDIRHGFDTFTLEAAFEAGPGVTALIGKSGAGKSTVANVIAGLLRADAATVSLNGAPLEDHGTGHWLRPEARRIGYVFQEARLFPHLSVEDNLFYGARRRRRMDKANAQSPGILALLGLQDLLGRRPGGLSGGERQRVAIGRALLSGPEMLLLDEPLSALDPARKAEILPYLERLRDQAEMPILYVSHAMEEVARLAQEVIVLDKGRIVATGPTATVLSDPTAVPSMGLAEAGAVIEARVEAHEEDGLTRLRASGGTLFLPRVQAEIDARIRVRVAASDIILAAEAPQNISALNVLPARVDHIHTGKGPGALVQLRSGEDRLLARVTLRSVDAMGLAPGRTLFVVVKSLAVATGNVGTGPEPGR